MSLDETGSRNGAECERCALQGREGIRHIRMQEGSHEGRNSACQNNRHFEPTAMTLRLSRLRFTVIERSSLALQLLPLTAGAMTIQNNNRHERRNNMQVHEFSRHDAQEQTRPDAHQACQLGRGAASIVHSGAHFSRYRILLSLAFCHRQCIALATLGHNRASQIKHATA
ncbi:hypothetical protein [Aquisediminimonas profunda]|uniref:hypothetical protein n=1 Tax=Aquisediminimonas profunda TaxID=1550733 RepID=UPI001C634E17|nr:hypothetical protein [Aquisediminimonas profunda]